MPIYEYHCSRCGEVFERLIGAKDADADIACPRCGKKGGRRLISICCAPRTKGETEARVGCRPRGFS